MKVLRNGEPLSFTVKGGKLGVNIKSRRPGDESYEFKTLLGYGKFISALGWIVAALAVLAVLGGLSSGEQMGIALALGGAVVAVLGVSLAASGQVISCFVAIESNTRWTYDILKEKFS